MERAAERTQAGEADSEGDISHRPAGVPQQVHRPLDPAPLEVPVRRLAEDLPEGADKVRFGDQRDPGQRRDVQRLGVVAVDRVPGPQHPAVGLFHRAVRPWRVPQPWTYHRLRHTPMLPSGRLAGPAGRRVDPPGTSAVPPPAPRPGRAVIHGCPGPRAARTARGPPPQWPPGPGPDPGRRWWRTGVRPRATPAARAPARPRRHPAAQPRAAGRCAGARTGTPRSGTAPRARRSPTSVPDPDATVRSRDRPRRRRPAGPPVPVATHPPAPAAKTRR